MSTNEAKQSPTATVVGSAMSEAEQQLRSEYVIGAKLGGGSFGVVHFATARNGNHQVAIKTVDMIQARRHRDGERHVNEEIAQLRKATEAYENGHPHIVRLYDVKYSPEKTFLVMEYCPGGDLRRCIEEPGQLQMQVIKSFMRQISSALQSLHALEIVHRDLKPENILLTSENYMSAKLKIADFGFARQLMQESLAQTWVGSPLYMAPELLRVEVEGNGGYTAKVDLWSVGAILYELVTKRPVYQVEIMAELMSAACSNPELTLPPHIGSGPELRSLLEGLLQIDPAQRMSHDDFFSHPFLQPPPPTADVDSLDTRTAAASAAAPPPVVDSELGESWLMISPDDVAPSLGRLAALSQAFVSRLEQVGSSSLQSVSGDSVEEQGSASPDSAPAPVTVEATDRNSDLASTGSSALEGAKVHAAVSVPAVGNAEDVVTSIATTSVPDPVPATAAGATEPAAPTDAAPELPAAVEMSVDVPDAVTPSQADASGISTTLTPRSEAAVAPDTTARSQVGDVAEHSVTTSATTGVPEPLPATAVGATEPAASMDAAPELSAEAEISADLPLQEDASCTERNPDAAEILQAASKSRSVAPFRDSDPRQPSDYELSFTSVTTGHIYLFFKVMQSRYAMFHCDGAADVYLHPDNVAAMRRQNDSEGLPAYFIGKCIMVEKHRASADYNPLQLPEGTSFRLVTAIALPSPGTFLPHETYDGETKLQERTIQFRSFTLGGLVLGLPAPVAGSAHVAPENCYCAFSDSESPELYFFTEESVHAFRRKHGQHFGLHNSVGEILLMTTHTASGTSAETNPYGFADGVQYTLLTVRPL